MMKENGKMKQGEQRIEDEIFTFKSNNEAESVSNSKFNEMNC